MGHNMVVTASNDTMSLSPSVFPPADPDPVFSEEEDTDDIPIGTKIKMKEKAMKSTYSTTSGPLTLTGPLLEIANSITELEGSIRIHIESLVTETDNEKR